MTPEGRDLVFSDAITLLRIVDSEALRRGEAEHSGLPFDLISMDRASCFAGFIKGVHLAQQRLDAALVDEAVRSP